jgi:2-polyprenyl-3-methyl-5-hydroxy-6-metoxy-1,4-benzoquinol methylase
MKLPPIRLVDDKFRFLEELASGKKVLHIGCADALADVDQKLSKGLFLHEALSRTAKELWGCDISRAGLERMRRLGFDNLVLANAEDLPSSPLAEHTFEVVIAAEVIEHLGNPAGLIHGARQLLATGGLLCLTTPNGALSLKTFMHSLTGFEMVAPDHVVLFSFTSLTRLLERAGYSRVRWYSALERHLTRRNNTANLLLRPFVRTFPYYADSLICLADPDGSSVSREAHTNGQAQGVVSS